METVLEKFVECTTEDSTKTISKSTITATKESPDKLSGSINRMASTRTDSRESPDKAFIPNRHI